MSTEERKDTETRDLPDPNRATESRHVADPNRATESRRVVDAHRATNAPPANIAEAATISSPTPTAPSPGGVAPVLTVELPDGAPQIIVLDRLPARLGRDDGADIVVDNAFLSRVHVEFRQGPQGVMVRDISSKNATLLNGIDLAGGEALLTDGAELELGPVKITVSVATPGASRGPLNKWVVGFFAGTVALAVVAFFAGHVSSPEPGGGPAPAAPAVSTPRTSDAGGAAVLSAKQRIISAKLQEYQDRAAAALQDVDAAVAQEAYYDAVDRLDVVRQYTTEGREYAATPEVQNEWQRLEVSDQERLNAQVEELEAMAEKLDKRQRTVLDAYLARLEARFASVRETLGEHEEMLDELGIVSRFDPEADLDPRDFSPDEIARRRRLRERWTETEGASWATPAFAGLCPDGQCAEALALLERRVTLGDADLGNRIHGLAQEWAAIERLQQRAAGDNPTEGLEGLAKWLDVANAAEEGRWTVEALVVESSTLDRNAMRRGLATVLEDTRFERFDFYREAVSVRNALDAEDLERLQPWLERIDTAMRDKQWADAYRQLQAANAEFENHPELQRYQERLVRQWESMLERARVQEQLNPEAAVGFYRDLYWSTPEDHPLHEQADDRLSVLGATP